MPSKEQLDAYYKNLYWDWRNNKWNGSKNHGAHPRDLVHYHLLKKYIPEFFRTGKKTIVNFGAGGGEISNLLWFDEIILNKCHEQTHRIEIGKVESWEENDNPEGPVRALGKMMK